MTAPSALRVVATAGAPITGLACHGGVVLAALATGQVAFAAAGGQLVPLVDTHGAPRALAVDPRSGDVFFTDSIRRAVIRLELPTPAGSGAAAAAAANAAGSSALWDALARASAPAAAAANVEASIAAAVAAWQVVQVRTFIDSFLDCPMRGPHGIAFDSRGEVLVTDPGALGDTGVTNPHGSVLRSVANWQQVVALAASGLAYPAGIACHARTAAVFVCEMSANRLLRFIPRVPPAVTSSSSSSSSTPSASSSASASSYVGSVFASFSGGMGPIAAVVDSAGDRVFVAKFDFAHAHPAGVPGEVVVLNASTGEVAGSVMVPGTAITALALDERAQTLYVAEGRTLYAVSVAAA